MKEINFDKIEVGTEVFIEGDMNTPYKIITVAGGQDSITKRDYNTFVTLQNIYTKEERKFKPNQTKFFKEF